MTAKTKVQTAAAGPSPDFTSLTGLESTGQFNFLTREHWEDLIACKKRFLAGDEQAPFKCPFLNHEIAASWLRAKRRGIDPNERQTKRQLSRQEYEALLARHHAIIEVAQPLLDIFNGVSLFNSSYILYLCDPGGAFLIQMGNMFRMNTDGLVWSEETVGTCALWYCLTRGRPVQLLGPEHYSAALHDIIATAAPIFDPSGQISCVLILGQMMPERPWAESFQNHRLHTMALTTALAKAMEGQVHLRYTNAVLLEQYSHLRDASENMTESNNRLQTLNNLLDTTMRLIDEGIVTLDVEGRILHVNQEGAAILQLSDRQSGGDIRDFAPKGSPLFACLAEGRDMDFEELLTVKGNEQSYLINLRSAGPGRGATLRLNHAEKIKSMGTRAGGNTAGFYFADIIGDDPVFKHTVRLAERFSHSTENILIVGESGTGKELFAHSIHNTCRPSGPFVALNCAAMPRGLVESELFGYEAGSFTGANKNGKPGKIEMAHGGTLFLDEIGDMPLKLQAVLLRVLEDKQVMRIGGTRHRKVDFRLIAATHENLYQMAMDGEFREDLYYRLSVLDLYIPPLRSRPQDIELLSRYFLRFYCSRQGRTPPKLSESLIAWLKTYDWPGNVRQLQNAIVHALHMATGSIIDEAHLPDYCRQDMDSKELPDGAPDVAGEPTLLLEVEKRAIRRALAMADNNVPEAAEMLGISRSSLYRKLKEYL
ncbi:MAG: sigma 54-interacting transcriptional regulator [Gracilibacteraceae bacterium]|jgi:transcriptional regulator with PAS, ATPase and Fis domain|nr:sigma 54-interacting transcriptional regulator [Gracilibacteraceae bacterium]